jgi:DNA-binding MarR family transcriptional regulator
VLHTRQTQNATATSVAEELGVALPTVSEVLRVLERRGLITKRKSKTDARTMVLSLTPKGRRRAEGVAGWTDFLAAAADELSDSEREALLRTLIKMIRILQEQGMIPIARMCVTCRFIQPYFYDDPHAPHHCGYVNAPFGDRLLRIECAEHNQAGKEERERNWQTFMAHTS